MKKAQTTVEYLLIFVLITIIIVGICGLWNRSSVINNATFGVEDNRGQIHVRPMTN